MTAAERTKLWRKNNPERAKEIAQKSYEKCREKRLERAREKYNSNPNIPKAKSILLKLEVLAHYGNQMCACCGLTDWEFLTIDHINGGGTKHRKELGKGGINFYKWLRANSYPSGYRVLCFNCNCTRGMYGYCPHEIQGESKCTLD